MRTQDSVQEVLRQLKLKYLYLVKSADSDLILPKGNAENRYREDHCVMFLSPQGELVVRDLTPDNSTSLEISEAGPRDKIHNFIGDGPRQRVIARLPQKRHILTIGKDARFFVAWNDRLVQPQYISSAEYGLRRFAYQTGQLGALPVTDSFLGSVYYYTPSEKVDHSRDKAAILKEQETAFKHEAKILQKLKCDDGVNNFIIRFGGFDEISNVMWFPPHNGTLDSLMKPIRDRHEQSGCIRPALQQLPGLVWMEPFIRQIASALAFLESEKIVHQDIKSPNIFYNCDDQAEGWIFVLGNFGYAKDLNCIVEPGKRWRAEVERKGLIKAGVDPKPDPKLKTEPEYNPPHKDCHHLGPEYNKWRLNVNFPRWEERFYPGACATSDSYQFMVLILEGCCGLICKNEMGMTDEDWALKVRFLAEKLRDPSAETPQEPVAVATPPLPSHEEKDSLWLKERHRWASRLHELGANKIIGNLIWSYVQLDDTRRTKQSRLPKFPWTDFMVFQPPAPTATQTPAPDGARPPQPDPSKKTIQKPLGIPPAAQPKPGMPPLGEGSTLKIDTARSKTQISTGYAGTWLPPSPPESPKKAAASQPTRHQTTQQREHSQPEQEEQSKVVLTVGPPKRKATGTELEEETNRVPRPAPRNSHGNGDAQDGPEEDPKNHDKKNPDKR
ncbi:hypothetical protein B0T26DRAFT_677983 [Lasiosphaeria miniovina]|uniref:Protein kinase domain-containing protein n=1 Tax=Lasiosphaeria miniovina TaxID=1954250 RepID=A0AA40DUC1_9PEZI|nr:uncharacterized protein B0T26DRAFT_677983 [Lasiosphaeria miniovina]KAK0713677.1 hypothetical protein B0T26DRAFT_677983 [Lasiosphaeria miniovina]